VEVRAGLDWQPLARNQAPSLYQNRLDLARAGNSAGDANRTSGERSPEVSKGRNARTSRNSRTNRERLWRASRWPRRASPGGNHAREELTEAGRTPVPSAVSRKKFYVSILSKCAVECLVDWYLSKHLLHLTIPQNAGLAQKLQTLDAEARLGIGRFLFQTTIFEPRNNAIHRYELVDLAQARNAYELANLTIRNCRNTEPAHLSPVFYGRLELYRGEEALRKAESQMKLRDAHTAFHFAGIGNSGEYAVFIDRNDRDSRISILTSLGNGAAEARLF